MWYRLMPLSKLLFAISVSAIALVLWEYAPALNGQPVYQDYHWSDDCGTTYPLSVRGFPRSIARVVFCAVDHREPWVGHAVSLGLHMLAAFLLAWLLWDITDAIGPACMAGLIFLLHPMAIESVAYGSARSEIIAGVGIVACCLAARHDHWLVALLALIVAVGGKETGIMAIPLALLARRSVWAPWSALWMAVLIMFAATMAQVNVGDTLRWWCEQSLAVTHLAALTVWPWLGLSILHIYAGLPLWVMTLVVIGSLGAVTLIWRTQVTGLEWVCLAILPRLLVQTWGSPLNEHQWYVPLMGCAMAFGCWATDAPQDWTCRA